MAGSLRAALCAPFIALPLAASAAGFATDAEGWTTSNGGDQVWVASGGNSGGWLSITDLTLDDFLLNAPTSWLGKWGSYAGGTLSFDVKNVNGESPDYSPFGEVTISGPGGNLVLDLVPAGNPPVDGQWHHYSATLSTAAGWAGAPLADVLNNVTSLTIKGEFHAGATEVLGIDNIQVSAVPEPAGAALMLAGLGLLGALRRRR